METNVTGQQSHDMASSPPDRARHAVEELDAMQVLQDLSARLCAVCYCKL